MKTLSPVLLLLGLAGLTVAGEATADRDLEPPVVLTLESLFGQEAATEDTPGEAAWRPGHSTVVWLDEYTADGPAMMEFDPETGSGRTLLSTARLIELWGDRAGEAPTITDPVWSPDGARVLIQGGSDPLLIDLGEATLTHLTTGGGRVEHARFSADGRRIAWVRDNDLWVFDLDRSKLIRLTDDGSKTIFNGAFDWVYEEELAGRDGRAFAWSEDGAAIAWLRLDDGEIPTHHLLDLMGTHSHITEQRYPKPGDPSPKPSLHVVRFDSSSDGSAPMSVTFDDPRPYIPRFGFTPGGDLWYQILDRAQETLSLVRANPVTGEGETLLEERDPYWVEPVDGLIFLDGDRVLWMSRRTGHMHLHLVRPGGSTTDLSPGPWDLTELVGVDPNGRFAWYEAARPNPLERRLFRVDLTSGDTTELTPGSGSHAGKLSPTHDRLLVRSTSLELPVRWTVCDSRGGAAVVVPVRDPRPEFRLAEHRMITIRADDGLELAAMLMLPPDFREEIRYPVVVYTYGGPHAQVVRNTWPRTSGLFNHYLTTLGFVVFALDNRGSTARGRDFEGTTDLGLGSKQLPDQLAGVKWLTEQTWVRPDRIGIWGWSYGGYMTAYALTHAPGTFAAGVAVAPVTDWALYDSIYTERYMDSPANNPRGYAESSVLNAVGNLVDPLLVIHGTGDDNVHVQHSLQFADRAWRAGVGFDLKLFPNLTHGIRAPGAHLQVFGSIAEFLEEHLMPAEEPSAVSR